MPEVATSKRAPPTLFAQIAVRLAAIALLFGLLNVGIVVANYALDQQAMAEDFIGQQAARVGRAWRDQGDHLAPLAAPAGAAEWSYQVLDGGGRVVIAGGATSASPALRPDASTLDWTRRDRTGANIQISGLRRLDDSHWVLVSGRARSFAVYLPVIARELRDHVAVPLIPLTVLLLAFNVVVVRRMLAPLATAAAEVNALDPARMDARLTEPAGSREVFVLVDAMNRALARLQHGMALLRDFTADAAHELRTPLSVLQLRLHDLPEGHAKRRLREDLQAMTRLVNQMLDLSQAEALSLEEAREIDLHALAEQTIAQTAPLAFEEDRDLRLVDLGGAPILGHADALGRVLRNLIENALRHASGHGPIDVIVGPGPRLAVRDYGRGLETTDPELVFRRFWKKRRDGSGGAGLGLGIARSIIEAHGGAISAANADSGGAIFTCEFPRLAMQKRYPSGRRMAKSLAP
jgi:signal transduction histidine kinase